MEKRMKILFLALSALLFLGCNDNKKEAPQKVVTKKAPVAQKKVVEVKEVKTEVVPKKVAIVHAATVDGGVVFKRCAGCHGANAEKKALGKSQVIKGWNKDKIIAALHGYKNGTYGGAMKGIMKGQAGKLSNAEISAVAEHISKL